jgi:hypothetical protein
MSVSEVNAKIRECECLTGGRLEFVSGERTKAPALNHQLALENKYQFVDFLRDKIKILLSQFINAIMLGQKLIVKNFGKILLI